MPLNLLNLSETSNTKNHQSGEIQHKQIAPSILENEANFETAISATKFGKYNLLLFLVTIPAAWSSVFETTTMSYVFPAAQCDLELTLEQKGSLNSITFLGMVTTGFIWGFLCDTLGRKKLMVTGYFLDGIFVIASSLSQNYSVLLISKFLGGAIINGPFAALAAYLSEFHSAQYRTKVQLARGLIVSCGTMILPLLAWAILPLKIHFTFINDTFIIHSWNLYLLICAIPPLLSGLIFLTMPESPKFLMTVGRNEEALVVFEKIFAMNTGMPRAKFPIKRLIDETKIQDKSVGKENIHITAKRNKMLALKEGFQQIKPWLFAPFLKYLVLVSSIEILLMFGVNCIRLWLPQIFQSISDYQFLNNGTTSDLCTMLGTIQGKSNNDTISTCFFNPSSSVYKNTIISASTVIIAYLLTASCVNKLGKKRIFVSASFLSGCCVIGMFYARNTATTTALSALFLALAGLSGNVLLTMAIDLFPTHLRTVTISIMLMLGRSSSVIGNMIFPILLSLGCAPPFISVGIAVICAAVLAKMLPANELNALV